MRISLILISILLISTLKVKSQATLPLSRTVWNSTPTGWTDAGTGSYTSSFACSGSNGGRMDSSGDRYTVFFNSAPNQLNYDLKISGSATSSCLVEESPDGTSWTTVINHTSLPTSCTSFNSTLNAASRYVRWTYTKVSQNLTIDDVTITAGTSCTPATEPSSNASSYVFSSVACNELTLTWTRPGGGSNDGCIVVARSGSDVTTDPTDGTVYSDDANFGDGDDIGSSEFVVYIGTGSTITITGLTANTTYHFNVFEFNGTSTCIDYRTSDEVTGNETTIACPPPSLPGSGGILINEFSNGASGSKEYYEFIVAGECGDMIDISGYIIDDNNGDFSSGTTVGTGIAAGHLRLKNVAQWNNIEVGSIIVVYNNEDANASLPADDPTDSNSDLLYVIPHDNTSLFEITTTLPTTANTNYSPATYASTMWGALGIANGGDAVQTRTPTGAYFHGVSYGGSAMSGGPDNLKISTSSMGGMVGYFSTGDFFDVSNWSTGTVATSETPGAANNAANAAWLALMRDPSTTSCPVFLPVEMMFFDGERIDDNHNQIYWKTASEINNEGFELLRSVDGLDFEVIAFITGAGTTQAESNYHYDDLDPNAGMNFYKLRQIDFDGKVKNSMPISIDNRSDNLVINRWNSDGKKLNLGIEGYTNLKPLTINIFDMLGNVVITKKVSPQSNIEFPINTTEGFYIVQLVQGNQLVLEKIKL